MTLIGELISQKCLLICHLCSTKFEQPRLLHWYTDTCTVHPGIHPTPTHNPMRLFEVEIKPLSKLCPTDIVYK